MKRKNKILVTMKALTLAAAVAVMVVSPSCRKETVGGAAGNVADGVRVITVQFDNSTKAVLGSDGLTPKFEINDRIRVSNATVSEECIIHVSGGIAHFTTNLDGELTAIYPSDAAVLASETTDAPIASSNNFKVPAIQTGKVEDAIIAMATIAGNFAIFSGVTALFEITPPSTAKIITVTSLKKVESGSRTGTAADINTENTGKTVITVGDGSADLPDTIYVALVPGVNLTDLSFDAGENIGLKGIPTSKLGTTYTDATAANTKYTIGKNNWHPYVEIQMNSKIYKWAKMNIGATSETEGGYYFFWGGTVGYKHDGSKWVKASDNQELSSGFASRNMPYYNYREDEYRKYTGSRTVLELADDAAYANWGGPWRMPTGGASGEFQALYSAAPGEWTTESGGVKGFKFTDNTTSKTLFFPAAGFGDGTTLTRVGDDGNYWSSSHNNTGDYGRAYRLYFDSSAFDPVNHYTRYYGYPVRPVAVADRKISEESANPAEMDENNVF